MAAAAYAQDTLSRFTDKYSYMASLKQEEMDKEIIAWFEYFPASEYSDNLDALRPELFIRQAEDLLYGQPASYSAALNQGLFGISYFNWFDPTSSPSSWVSVVEYDQLLPEASQEGTEEKLNYTYYTLSADKKWISEPDRAWVMTLSKLLNGWRWVLQPESYYGMYANSPSYDYFKLKQLPELINAPTISVVDRNNVPNRTETLITRDISGTEYGRISVSVRKKVPIYNSDETSLLVAEADKLVMPAGSMIYSIIARKNSNSYKISDYIHYTAPAPVTNIESLIKAYRVTDENDICKNKIAMLSFNDDMTANLCNTSAPHVTRDKVTTIPVKIQQENGEQYLIMYNNIQTLGLPVFLKLTQPSDKNNSIEVMHGYVEPKNTVKYTYKLNRIATDAILKAHGRPATS